MDNVARENVPLEQRREAVVPYQVIGQPNSAEIATEGINRALKILEILDDETLASSDAHNAFGAVDRHEPYHLVREKLRDFLYFYLFLHGAEIDVQFDAHHMLGGTIQGLASSGLLYPAVKWSIDQKAHKLMIQRCPEFAMDFQVDYMDDGGQLMNDQFAAQYLEISKSVYAEWNIQFNKDKTQIIMNTNTPHRIRWLNATFHDYLHSTTGQLTFLGVPHGDKDYVVKHVHKRLNKIYTKMSYIEGLQHTLIRTNIYRKLFDFNKVSYTLKHTQPTAHWIEDVNNMYKTITASMTFHLYDKYKETIQWQLSMSQKSGKDGMRRTKALLLCISNRSHVHPRRSHRKIV